MLSMRIITLAFTLFSFTIAKAQPTFQLKQYATGFSSPIDITNAGDDRLFIAERAGVIKIIDKDGSTIATPYLDIKSKIKSGGEQGLLGLTFHPNYKENGFFFVNYTNTGGDTHISKFKVSYDPNKGDPASEVVLMKIDQPYSNHNAGDLCFGKDGYLYFGLGDGGSGGDPQGNGQNKKALLGKMIRIDVDKKDNGKEYAIPADNPFVNDDSTLDEIWALGVRNPWRISFDRETDDLWIADVGQDKWEELDFEPAGSKGGLNYGWKCREGKHDFGNGCNGDFTEPIVEYDHSQNGGYSVTGGFVYRGCMYSNLNGVYFMTDYVTGHFWTVQKDGNDWKVDRKAGVQKNISTFGQDSKGELYAGNISNGTIYMIEGEAGEEIKITEQPKSQEICKDAAGELSVKVSGSGITYQWYKDGEKIDNATESTYKITKAELSDSGMYHVVIGSENCKSLALKSDEAKLEIGCTNTDDVLFEVSIGMFPVPADNVLNIHFKALAAKKLSIYIIDTAGRTVYNEDVNNFSGLYKKGIDIKPFAPGNYHVKMVTNGQNFVRKVVVQ